MNEPDSDTKPTRLSTAETVFRSAGLDTPHIPDDLLRRYVDGAVGMRERARVESHLAACPRCDADRAALQSFAEALSRAPTPVVVSPRPIRWAALAGGGVAVAAAASLATFLVLSPKGERALGDGQLARARAEDAERSRDRIQVQLDSELAARTAEGADWKKRLAEIAAREDALKKQLAASVKPTPAPVFPLFPGGGAPAAPNQPLSPTRPETVPGAQITSPKTNPRPSSAVGDAAGFSVLRPREGLVLEPHPAVSWRQYPGASGGYRVEIRRIRESGPEASPLFWNVARGTSLPPLAISLPRASKMLLKVTPLGAGGKPVGAPTSVTFTIADDETAGQAAAALMRLADEYGRLGLVGDETAARARAAEIAPDR